MELRGTAIHSPVELYMVTQVQKYIEGRQRRGFESKAELQEIYIVYMLSVYIHLTYISLFRLAP